MCCGNKRGRMTKTIDPNVEVVRVIYASTNMARSQLYGGSRVLGRPQNYGYRKPGDVFDVIVNDIVAQPNLFHAWPCDQPFTIENNKVINPCGEMGTEERVGSIEGLPGIGKKTAERLAAMGIFTEEDVLNNVDEKILNGLPPRSRKAIREWQISQKQ